MLPSHWESISCDWRSRVFSLGGGGVSPAGIPNLRVGCDQSRGLTALDFGDSGLLPTALFAVTVNRYATRGFRLRTL